MAWETVPTGYDMEGCPIYEKDELDERYDALYEELRATGDHETFDALAHALRHRAAAPLRERVLDMLREVVDRECQREAEPTLLSEHDGRALWRANVVDDLRVHRDRYEAMREQTGWPVDPAALGDADLSAASLVVMHPDLLNDMARRCRGEEVEPWPWTD